MSLLIYIGDEQLPSYSAGLELRMRAGRPGYAWKITRNLKNGRPQIFPGRFFFGILQKK